MDQVARSFAALSAALKRQGDGPELWQQEHRTDLIPILSPEVSFLCTFNLGGGHSCG